MAGGGKGEGKVNRKRSARVASPGCRRETAWLRQEEVAYRQGRVIAPTPEEAARLVEEKHPGLDKITLFPCPVQPWLETTWWEWVGQYGKVSSG